RRRGIAVWEPRLRRGRVTALVAHLALKRGDAKQAMAIIEEAIERTEKTIGSRHPRTLWLQRQRANILLNAGEADQASAYALEVSERCKEASGGRETLQYSALHVYGTALNAQCRFRDARRVHARNWVQRCLLQGPFSDHTRESAGAWISTWLGEWRGTNSTPGAEIHLES
ncbi:MAG: tetratricopeptide repeat protein, partial [Phycisphaerae bacterium]